METTKERTEKASELFRKGHQAQLQGELGDAMRCYQESVQIHPTAEAHTFLGWTYSFLQRYEDAIEECRNAIAIDPEFGNPYNDIDDKRHYPHLNLGRIALAKGDLLKAAREFGRALEVQPRSLTARRTLAALSAQLN